MNRRQQLAARRAELIARCELQRRELRVAADDVGRSLWAVDAAMLLARRAAAHPLLISGAVVVAIVAFRPQRIGRYLAWGISAALTFRRASTLWRSMAYGHSSSASPALRH